jgi:hypothetical protein
MPQYIEPTSPHAYHGLPGLVEFTNEDGRHPRYNCGQAAAATLLCALGASPAQRIMAWLEKEHGPDNLWGWLGTSRRRVERALRAMGRRPRAIHGEGELRRRLAAGVPVIVAVQLSIGRFWRFDIPSGHWMVAFGFDEEHVYLTNWWDNRMPWAEFRAGWHGWVPALTGMRGTGLVADRRMHGLPQPA